MPHLMLVLCLVLLSVALAFPAQAVEVETAVDAPMEGIVEITPDLSPVGPDETPGLTPDDVTLPETTVDNTAVLEALSTTNTLLSYIFVMGLLFFAVTVCKLIYSFFNMLF